MTAETRPPLPPFTHETAMQKVRMAEDGWNSRDPERVALAYTVDSRWRNRSEFPRGREQIREFLTRKWQREQQYRLIKELWAFEGHRIAVRFAYEWHDAEGQWYRSYGNENWEFDEHGLMQVRHASINDLPIREDQRLFHWPQGRRPDEHPGLSELGLWAPASRRRVSRSVPGRTGTGRQRCLRSRRRGATARSSGPECPAGRRRRRRSGR